MTELQEHPREYTLPDGCPVCAADVPVKVTAGHGPRAVCKRCGWIGKAEITVTHRGLTVAYDLPQA